MVATFNLGTKAVNPPPGRKPAPTVQFRRGTRIGSGSTATGVTSNSSSLIQAQQHFVPDQTTVQNILGMLQLILKALFPVIYMSYA